MSPEQLTYRCQLITDNPHEQNEIRILCREYGRDERERVERSLVERFFEWLLGEVEG